MSFDLWVWHEPARITAAEARAKLAPDAAEFPAHPAIARMRADVLARFPLGGSGQVWVSDGAEPGTGLLAFAIVPRSAAVVGDVVRSAARRHGLICYDPQLDVVNPNVGEPAFTLSSASLAPVGDPDDRLIERTIRRLRTDDFFAVLQRADGWFVQIAYGPRAGAPPGTYALEYQEGGPGRHFRCTTTDLSEAVRLAREFYAGDKTWQRRHVWRRLEL